MRCDADAAVKGALKALWFFCQGGPRVLDRVLEEVREPEPEPPYEPEPEPDDGSKMPDYLSALRNLVNDNVVDGWTAQQHHCGDLKQALHGLHMGAIDFTPEVCGLLLSLLRFGDRIYLNADADLPPTESVEASLQYMACEALVRHTGLLHIEALDRLLNTTPSEWLARMVAMLIDAATEAEFYRQANEPTEVEPARPNYDAMQSASDTHVTTEPEPAPAADSAEPVPPRRPSFGHCYVPQPQSAPGKRVRLVLISGEWALDVRLGAGDTLTAAKIPAAAVDESASHDVRDRWPWKATAGKCSLDWGRALVGHGHTLDGIVLALDGLAPNLLIHAEGGELRTSLIGRVE